MKNRDIDRYNLKPAKKAELRNLRNKRRRKHIEDEELKRLHELMKNGARDSKASRKRG
jgi:hypothetical protein